jgi:hypothetical protein
MIKNFIIDADLEAFYPDIESYRAGAQTDFSDQISLAFRTLLNDLQARGRNPRLLGVPLDLNRDASSTHLQQLVSETITTTDNGYAWEGTKERRFHVNITTKSTLGDAWTITLQGSNKTERPSDSDSTWETVATITSGAAVAAAESSTVFDSMYRWYRRRITVTGSGSIVLTCALHDTIFDNLISWKAIELIAQSWNTGLSTLWETRVQDAKANYVSVLEHVITNYDDNEDGIPEETEEIRTNIRLRR